jgi:hypothetical protein
MFASEERTEARKPSGSCRRLTPSTAETHPGNATRGVGWHGLVRLSTFVIAVQQSAASVRGPLPGLRHPFDTCGTGDDSPPDRTAVD